MRHNDAVKDALRQIYLGEETKPEDENIEEMVDGEEEEVAEEWMFEEVDAEEDPTSDLDEDVKAAIDQALIPIAAKLDDIEAEVAEDELQEAAKGRKKANLLRNAALAGMGLLGAGGAYAASTGKLGPEAARRVNSVLQGVTNIRR